MIIGYLDRKQSGLAMLNSMTGARRSNIAKYRKRSETPLFVSTASSSKSDSLTISSEGKAKSAINHRNTSVDKTIDLKSYMDNARKNNEEALSDAGTSINRNAVKFTALTDALRAALNDKYARVSKAAASYHDKEQYLQDKYFNRASSIYESDLSDSERGIGYRNEKSYLASGSVRGVNTGDSLFRGMEFSGDVMDNDRLIFERKTINAQITNILGNAGIDTKNIPESCTFSVDPYSYKITADGVDEDMKAAMEDALNVGNNGKNLFLHIRHIAGQGGSTQITSENKTKYHAAQLIREYTGLDIREMTEKDGTFYTDDGEDIIGIVNKAVDKKVPYDYRKQIKDWVQSLVTEVTDKGWNNMPDMTMSISFGRNGLHDIGLKNSGILDKSSLWYAVM